MPRVALNYTKEEGGLVSIIIPDSDDEERLISAREGCELLWIEEEVFLKSSPTDLQEHVNTHTKKRAPDPRLAIVDRDTGDVVDAIVAYPSLAKLTAKYEAVRNAEAAPGDKIVNGTLQKKFIPIEEVLDEIVDVP